MYTPTKFQITDLVKIHQFIRQHNFGLLLTVDGDAIHDTHTPLILSENGETLWGHVAKANPQWKNWGSATDVKVIFQGPHAYISPSYLVSDFNVPTWNYTAVSVCGELSVVEDEQDIVTFFDRLISQHEDQQEPWVLDHDDERYMQLLSAIVVFKVTIKDMQAAFKLNQNKSLEDQQSVVDKLSQFVSPMSREVAELMLDNIQQAE